MSWTSQNLWQGHGMTNHERTCTVRDAISPGCWLTYDIEAPTAERARQFLADPAAVEVVEPRYAATVLLVSAARPHHRAWERDEFGRLGEPVLEPAQGPVDVFMLRRASTMAFVPDAVVFPGGGMDPSDREFDGAWGGPDPETWAQAMDCTPDLAQAVLVTAARELFEESGVLLASTADGAMAQDARGDHWAFERAAIAERSLLFGEFLNREGLVLRSDLLHLRSHWVTPPSEARRYNTYFFLARLPEGQHADGRTSEAVESSWITPNEAFARFDDGYLKLVPPTISNLRSLAKATSVDDACALPFDGHVRPLPTETADGSIAMMCEVV